jgi:hypothetical protein
MHKLDYERTDYSVVVKNSDVIRRNDGLILSPL